ncbi:hypothetical protein VSS74_29275, partial [Conexibacter stalactiti]
MTRAYIAGLGTTGALLAAAACLFVIASAVVAFDAWPGSHVAQRSSSVEAPAPVAARGGGRDALVAVGSGDLFAAAATGASAAALAGGGAGADGS